MLQYVNRCRFVKVLVSASLLTSLIGCGGGGGSDSASAEPSPDLYATLDGASGFARAQATSSTAANLKPATRMEAARFLTQATFGPTSDDINRVMTLGYTSWLNEQFTAPTAVTYKSYWDKRDAAIRAKTPHLTASVNELNHVFWANAITGKDQVRQRVALALSEIFVISTQDGCGNNLPQGAATYFDMLVSNAFGTYRDLLEKVTLHPIMGCFLSHLKNQKEDMVTGRVPDENYAREVMQLFSIGLYQLNQDGTPKPGSNGLPIETYTSSDISGLAKVFTGWGHSCPAWPSDNCFKWSARTGDNAMDPNRWSVPMRPYAQFHSTSEKRFLGKVIPVQRTPDPQGSLRIALDTLASHPNVGPFIGKQLIQRLVTSNPSPAYVRRVADVFNASGGSLRLVVTAILTDPEARNLANLNSPTFGKLREPILRLSAFFRAYQAKSSTGSFLMWITSDAGTGLAQSPFQAPSVFNFFRPNYTPPGSETFKAGLVAPEMQLAHETSAAGYVNYMRTVISWGSGSAGYDNKGPLPDILLNYQADPNSFLFPLADYPAAMADDISQRLMYGTMSTGLKSEISTAISTIYYGSKTKQSVEERALTRKLRLWSALLLAVSSPEFQVQK